MNKITPSNVLWLDEQIPHTEGQNRNWETIANELRQHPGRWANVGIGARSLAWKLGAGQVAAINPDEFEVVSRGAVDTKPQIWMRYTGEAIDDVPPAEGAGEFAPVLEALSDLTAAVRAIAERSVA